MRAYPEIRGAKPARAFWLARFVPCVQVWARQVHVGFWKSKPSVWNPVMTRRRIVVDRFGVRFEGLRRIVWLNRKAQSWQK